MILTGPEIHRCVFRGTITIDPFREDRLNPNSYNLSLQDKLLRYREYRLDAGGLNPTVEINIPKSGLVLDPGILYLGAAIEYVGSDHYVPIIRGRSGTARLGLFVHVTADLIDQGSFNNLNFQLHAVQPLRIYPGEVLAQVTFWVPQGERVLYAGKYGNSRGPVGSLYERYEGSVDSV